MKKQELEIISDVYKDIYYLHAIVKIDKTDSIKRFEDLFERLNLTKERYIIENKLIAEYKNMSSTEEEKFNQFFEMMANANIYVHYDMEEIQKLHEDIENGVIKFKDGKVVEQIDSLKEIELKIESRKTIRKHYCKKLTVANVKYATVKKSKGVSKELKLSYRQLETIVEMGMDYSQIVREKRQTLEENDCYKKALYAYKANEIVKITNYIAANIEYSKGCKRKEREETGVDALMAASVLSHR